MADDPPAGTAEPLPGSVTVRPLIAQDWAAVEPIYAAGIASGNATFDPHAVLAEI